VKAEHSSHAAFVRILQDAHAGELAAALAYRGHWKSIRRDPAVRAEIKRIEGTEWHHRALVAEILHSIGCEHRRARELLMWSIGRFFGMLCYVSLRFWPMYAAGRLEAMNVAQYERARELAAELGFDEHLPALAAMRDEEVRHETFFGEQCRDHWLLPLAAFVGRWRPPEPAVAATREQPRSNSAA
jgi:demethoxyubiquinone hydroxylase (CLK1/Coq7/Cat5 family)